MNPQHDHIDHVLNALRDATPPANMERRILNLLEAEANKPAQATNFSPRNARTTAAACCAALAIAALIGKLTMHHPKAPVTSITQTTPTQAPNASRPTIAAAPTQRSHSTTPHATIQPHVVQVAQSEADQISHPAPPIPLTEQERILLRFARHRRTDDLAQISNDRKAAKEERDAAEFQAFFEPPPIKIGESE